MNYSPLKISAKNLGYTALEDFCPRCYWLKLKSKVLPWQTFPGIFASIDAYTKHCIHHIIDRNNGALRETRPEWMLRIGNVDRYEKVPHWSKNLYLDVKSNITLSGAPDDVWVTSDQRRIIPDYKTAKHTDTQDKLFPMYEIQEIVYSILIDPKAELYLIYMEPKTEPAAACENIIDCGFALQFSGVVVPIENNKKKVREALTITRDIYEKEKAPEGRTGCKDCKALDEVIGLLGMGKVSNAGLEE